MCALLTLLAGLTAQSGSIPATPSPSPALIGFLRASEEEVERIGRAADAARPTTPDEIVEQLEIIEKAVGLEFDIKQVRESLEASTDRRSEFLRKARDLEDRLGGEPATIRTLRQQVARRVNEELFPPLGVRRLTLTVLNRRRTVALLTPGKQMVSYLAPTDLFVLNDLVRDVPVGDGRFEPRRFLGRAAYDDQGLKTRLALSFDARLGVDPAVWEAVRQRFRARDEEDLEEGLPDLEFALNPVRRDQEGLELLAGVVTNNDTFRFSMMLNQHDGRQSVALENLCSPRGLPISLSVTSGEGKSRAVIPDLKLTLARRTVAVADNKANQSLINQSPFAATVAYYMQDDHAVPFDPAFQIRRDSSYSSWPVNPFSVRFPAEAVTYENLDPDKVLDREFAVDLSGFSVDKVHLINKLQQNHPRTGGQLLYVEANVRYQFVPEAEPAQSSTRVAGTFKLAPAPAVGSDTYIPFPKNNQPGTVTVQVDGRARYTDAVRAFTFCSQSTVVRIDEDAIDP